MTTTIAGDSIDFQRCTARHAFNFSGDFFHYFPINWENIPSEQSIVCTRIPLQDTLSMCLDVVISYERIEKIIHRIKTCQSKLNLTNHKVVESFLSHYMIMTRHVGLNLWSTACSSCCSFHICYCGPGYSSTTWLIGNRSTET